MIFTLILSTLSVIDGDTLNIDGQSHRLHGIDAPELRRAQCDKEKRWGYEAKGFLSGYLIGKDVQITHNYGLDRYDRPVVDVSVNGEDLGQTLINEGYAQAWDYDGGEQRPEWC